MPSTRDYDRGDKFAVYRQLASLREYVLVNPNEYAVDVFRFSAHQLGVIRLWWCG